MSAEHQATYRLRHPDRVDASIQRYRQSEKGRATTAARKRKAYADGRWTPSVMTTAKRAAYRAVEVALRDGVLTRPNQCGCGSNGPVHAHHGAGYDQALDVTWLCRRCHALAHGQGRAA